MRAAVALWTSIALLAVGVVAPGCRTAAGPARETTAVDQAEERSAPAPGAEVKEEAPPDSVNDSLLPPLHIPAPEEADLEEPRFDVSVNDVPVREFVMDLVEGTPYAVVVHPDVDGKLSLTLKDVTIPEILAAVRAVYGYEFEHASRTYYLLPSQLRSKIFHVNYLHLQREGRSQTRVSSGQLSEQVGDSSGTGTAVFAPTTTGGRGRGVIESSQVKTDSETHLWEELGASLRAIVGSEEGRSVVMSPQAGIVFVRAMPSELRQVEEFLRRAASNLQRQVVLETKILEVELNDEFRAGINWAALIDWGTKSILAGQTGGGTILGDLGVSEIAGNTGLLDPSMPSFPSNTDTSAFGGVFSAALDLNDFTAFIELLETQGDVQVLSSPLVSTVNNQKAVIKVGSDEFFVTDVSSTTVTGTATTTTPNVELTPFFSGIALDVTPQISEEGDVILHVHPSVSQVQDQTKEITVGGDLLTLPLAFSTIRESDSIVRARSGQVVVIGGLMEERSVEVRARTPLIGRIPYLGALFGHTRTLSVKSELVILLRPRVGEASAWNGRVKRLEERFEQSPWARPEVRSGETP